MSLSRVDGTRYAATGLAAVVTALYVLIGANVVTVIEDQAEAAPTPMFLAAAVFAALSVALLVVRRPWVAVAGSVLQLLVLVGYVAVASGRTPAYEGWGLSVKALQVALLVLLVALFMRRSALAAQDGRRTA